MAESDKLDLSRPQPTRRLTSEEDQRRALVMAAARYPDELGPEVAALLREEAIAAEKNRMSVRDEARRLLASESAARSFPGFSGLPLGEALRVPRVYVPPLIEGLQYRGHKATLVAQFKTGKTTLTGNVVRSLADTEPFLGRFEVPELPGNIAVFDYELTADDAIDMYRALGVRRDDRVHVESLRGRGFTLADDHHAALTVDFLRSHEIAYWVLDPFGRAIRGFGSENSNDDVRGFLMRLDEIVTEAGVLGVLLPVHTGRALAEVGEERARGATVLDDDPDVRWLLTRNDEQRRFFRAEGRAGVSVEEFALDFEPASLRLTATDLSRREVSGQKHRPGVMAWVIEHPGASVRDIKANVSGKDSSVEAALNQLVAEGEIVRVQDGRARRHYLPGEVPAVTE